MADNWTALTLAKTHGPAMLKSRLSFAKLATKYGVSKAIAQEAVYWARQASRAAAREDAKDAAAAIDHYFTKAPGRPIPKPAKRAEPKKADPPPEPEPGATPSEAAQTLGFLFRHAVSDRPTKGVKTTDEFNCLRLGQDITLGQCLDDYCDVTAFKRKGHICWMCKQGAQNRRDFARGEAELTWSLDREPVATSKRGRRRSVR